MVARVAVRLYRLLLRLVPRDLGRRAGAEMESLFHERLSRARGIGRLLAMVHEYGGVVLMAGVSRLDGYRERRRGSGGRIRRSGPMDTFARDVKYAIRSVTRRPAVTVLAVLTFALGVGASTAMFSVVDAVLLEPLPYDDPGQVVSVYTMNKEFEGHPTLGFAALRGSFSDPEMEVLREGGADVLAGLAMVYTGGSSTIYGSGEPERVSVSRATQDLFGKVLRSRVLMGRVFSDEDDRTQSNVMLLEEGFWRGRFGSDPSIVGTTIRLGDTPYEVIGVLSEETTLTGARADAWVLTQTGSGWDNHTVGAIGRLQSGVTPQQASARLSSLLAGALPPGHGTHGVSVFERQSDQTRSVRGPLLLLALASIVLLIVACGNVAALLIGAAIDREQELAVRAALGAERGRLIRQMLTESGLLGAAAAVVGLVLALAVTRGLVLIAPQGVPRIGDATIDAKALVFAIVVALTCGILFGLVPALAFSRTDLRRSMTITSRSVAGTRGRVQGIVVVAEVALATVLLVGAGLLARTVLALNAVDTGLATSETLSVRTSIPTSRLVDPGAPDSVRNGAVDSYYMRVAEAMGTLPGVRGVAITSNLPLSGDRGNNTVGMEGWVDEEVVAERRFVSANYFDVLGIRMVEGRAFTEDEDRPGVQPAVIISEGLAKLAWPNESAIGKRFRWWSTESIVVGVAADVRDEEMQYGTTYAYYVPRRAAGQSYGTFVLRTAVDPTSIVPLLRERVRTVNPDIVIASAEPLSSLVTAQIANERYRARLIVVFAGLAALFSLMGVYGVTARSVAARTREMGIRVALGARRNRILGLVIGQAVRLSAAGAVLGLLASFATTRGIEAYIWGVERTDAVTLVTIAIGLAGASVLAALAPGLRAARIDPVEALRDD